MKSVLADLIEDSSEIAPDAQAYAGPAGGKSLQSRNHFLCEVKRRRKLNGLRW